MLILTIGDLHIPERTIDIPLKFKKLLQPRGKIQQVLCLGNITNSISTLNYLKSLSPDFQMVKGEFDDDISLPQSLVFNYDNLKVGIINGFQVVPKSDPLSLLTQARMMGVDILIYGSTHKVEAYTLDGKFFINPGSATGAYSTDKMDKEDVDIVEKILKEKLYISESIIENDDEKYDKKDNETKDIKKDVKNFDKKDDIIKNQMKDELKNENEDECKDKIKDGSKEENKCGNREIETEKSKKPKKDEVKEGSTDNTNEDTIGKSKEYLQLNAEEDQIENNSTFNDDEQPSIDEYLDPLPSFCLLDIQGTVCSLYLYTLIEDEVKVDKLTYRKDESA